MCSCIFYYLCPCNIVQSNCGDSKTSSFIDNKPSGVITNGSNAGCPDFIRA